MSNLFINLEVVAGTFLQLAVAGTEVGSGPVNIVGPGFFPAGNSGAWGSFGDVPSATLELMFKELDERITHLPEGGSWPEPRRRLTGAIVRWQPYDMTEMAMRMAMAVKTELVHNTPAAPLRNLDPHIEGWLNWQNRGEDGVDLSKLALYGKMRLESSGGLKFGDIDTTRPAYAFRVSQTSIASLVTAGFVPA